MVSNKNRMKIHQIDGVTVLDLGDIEIWDGADLALLRETLIQVIEVDKCRSIGVNMRSVKYIPSGFFGMLHDWHQRGIAVRLYSPQPKVQKMLWFRQFCDHIADGCFLLLGEPKQEMRLSPEPEWDDQTIWEDDRESGQASRGCQPPDPPARSHGRLARLKTDR